VEGNERVGIVPVPTGLGMTVNNSDVRITFVEQGIRECHTNGAASYDEVISFHYYSVPN
jgi:hypothetical protein